MGKQLTGIQMDKKQISMESNGTLHAVPQITEDDREFKVEECTAENTDGDECYEKQGVPSFPDGNLVKIEVQISVEENKLSSPGVGKTKYTVPKPFMLATERRARVTYIAGVKTEGTGVNCSPKASSDQSPRSVKSSQFSFKMNSPILSRKLLRGNGEKSNFDDDDDCRSLTSSAAGSVQTNKSRTTIASAPIFKCAERAEKRKEFYTKLEEKHRALGEERKQFQARIKEEQEAVLKQLRKNMTYKANPVPVFYHQGLPLTPELKKLPVTIPKSPKLHTTRRKSSDVFAPSVEEKEKVPARAVRSTGTHKQESLHMKTLSPSTWKIQASGRSSVCGTPPIPKLKEQSKKEIEASNSAPPKMEEQTSSDIFI